MIAVTTNVDRVLAESFPASDPPSWVFGGASAERTADTIPARPLQPRRLDDVIAVPQKHAMTWMARALKHLRSWLMACAVVLLAPIGIVTLPLVLLVRAALSASGWRLGGGK